MTAQIRLRRVYDDPSPEDGVRVLVDRIWPRGLAKDAACLDEWARDVAPSTALRTWYGHDPQKFAEFRRRYQAELTEAGPGEALGRLRRRARDATVTLLTATKDVERSQAAVLAEELRRPESPVPSTAPFTAGRTHREESEGGEPACWAYLVCPECGAVTSEGHGQGCPCVPGGEPQPD